MKRSIFFLAVAFPLCLCAGVNASPPLDTWELAENSLRFDVRTIVYQGDEEDEPIPATPSVTLELYQGNFFKLSLISRAEEGYAFPHFLPGPPAHVPSPSTRATAGFGYYAIHSDTLRFNAHYVRLIADGVDLEEILKQSDDAGALNEFRIVLSFVNALFIDLFNDLYAYRSGDRWVFALPRDSNFAPAPGDSGEGIVWELQRSGRPPPTSMTAVQATVLGAEVEGLTLAFARSISGRPVHYAWGGVTDESGRVDLDIVTLDRSGVTGYYSARARNGSGAIVGQWRSIPLNEDRRQILELTPGERARVAASHRLGASKVVAPEGGQPPAGLAPNVPNPFNGSTLIVYRLAGPGPVRLEIFNSLGQRVRTLVDDVQAAGRYRVRWDARDRRGAEVAAGVYLTRLVHPGGVDARRMLFLK